jgi:hypothetical protein
MAALYGKRRTYQNSSTIPFVYEDCAPSGCTWEFDYQWEQESADDAPSVFVTAVRLTAHDGTEYPIKVGSLDGRWIAEIESLISDEIAAENEAYWESQR